MNRSCLATKTTGSSGWNLCLKLFIHRLPGVQAWIPAVTEQRQGSYFKSIPPICFPSVKSIPLRTGCPQLFSSVQCDLCLVLICSDRGLDDQTARCQQQIQLSTRAAPDVKGSNRALVLNKKQMLSHCRHSYTNKTTLYFVLTPPHPCNKPSSYFQYATSLLWD